MNRYNSNLSFIDILFNLLIGFVCLFIIAFLLINPPAETGKVDPRVSVMVTLEWDNDVDIDLDLWLLGPVNPAVGFSYQENGYISYERDDLGSTNDTYYVDGEEHIISRNLETITVNGIVPGEYFVSMYFYHPNTEMVIEGKITVYQMDPYRLVYEGTRPLTYKEEVPMFSFYLNEDGVIVNETTSINRLIVPQSTGVNGP